MYYTFSDIKKRPLTLTSQLWSYCGTCWVSTLTSICVHQGCKVLSSFYLCSSRLGQTGSKSNLASDQSIGYWNLTGGPSGQRAPALSVLERFINDQHSEDQEVRREDHLESAHKTHTPWRACVRLGEADEHKHKTALHPRRVCVYCRCTAWAQGREAAIKSEELLWR